MNIRPFIEAGILRKPPNIKWTKDRGKEPERPKDEYPWFWDGDTFRGERVNDVHTTIAGKQSARKEQGAARKWPPQLRIISVLCGTAEGGCPSSPIRSCS